MPRVKQITYVLAEWLPPAGRIQEHGVKKTLKALVNPVRKHPRLFQAVRSLWSPRYSIYQHMYFNGEFAVEISPGKSFKIWHYGHALENDLFWKGYAGHEATSAIIWSNLCRVSQYIADIGANTGLFSLVAATENPSASIVSFEPVGAIYRKLVKNIESNNFNILAFQLAVSDTDGHAVLYDPGYDHSYSASLEKEKLNLDRDHGYSVRTVCIDSFLGTIGFPRLDLIKIDVELHEPNVLRGMIGLLKHHRPSLLVEVLRQSTGARIEEIISDLNYKIYYIEEGKGAINCSSVGQYKGNYLICREEVWRKLEPVVGIHTGEQPG